MAKRNIVPVPPIVVVQEIRTHWTKTSRGGDMAARRNAVPEQLRLPNFPDSAEDFVLLHHRAFFDEPDSFVTPAETLASYSGPGPLTIGCIKVQRNGDTVSLTYRYSSGCGGAPPRSSYPRSLFAPVGRWIQIVTNGRFVYSDGVWHYQKLVVNAGIFSEVKHSAFTAEEPRACITDIAHLF